MLKQIACVRRVSEHLRVAIIPLHAGQLILFRIKICFESSRNPSKWLRHSQTSFNGLNHYIRASEGSSLEASVQGSWIMKWVIISLSYHIQRFTLLSIGLVSQSIWETCDIVCSPILPDIIRLNSIVAGSLPVETEASESSGHEIHWCARKHSSTDVLVLQGLSEIVEV
jgi:hypothetical protein